MDKEEWDKKFCKHDYHRNPDGTTDCPACAQEAAEKLALLLVTHDQLNAMSDVIVVRVDDLRNLLAKLVRTPDPEAAAEIKALREALTKISRLSPSAFKCDRGCADAAKNIALAALKDHRKVRT